MLNSLSKLNVSVYKIDGVKVMVTQIGESFQKVLTGGEGIVTLNATKLTYIEVIPLRTGTTIIKQNLSLGL
jgi:uncharacterized protein (AIM24 family)